MRVVESELDTSAGMNQKKSICPSTLLEFLPLALAVLVLLICFVVSRPFHIYPVNDEWAYSIPVFRFLETGRLVFPATTAFALTQILVAIPLCKVFGSSYVVLRVTTLCFGVLATIAIYLVLRERGLKRWDSGSFALCFASSPFVLNLSSSFMTDVPWIATSMLSLLFLARALKDNRQRNWTLSSLFFCVSLAGRQTSLIILPAVILVLSIRHRISRIKLQSWFFMVACPVLAYLPLDQLVKSLSMFPQPADDYKLSLLMSLSTILRKPLAYCWAYWRSSVFSIVYLSLFAFPIVVSMALSSLTGKRLQPVVRFFALTIVLVGLPLYYLVTFQEKNMPFSPNLLSPPFYVGGYCLLNIELFDSIQAKVVTSISVFLALMLFPVLAFSLYRIGRLVLKHIVCVLSNRTANEPICEMEFRFCFDLYVACCFVLISAVNAVLTTVHNLDRYYLAAFPYLLLLLASCYHYFRNRLCRRMVIPLCILTAFIGTLQALDNNNFLRARNKCIEVGLGTGTPANLIDGGPEFNIVTNLNLLKHYKLNAANPSLSCYSDESRGTSNLTRDSRWWPITGEKFIVSGKPEFPGYKRVFASHYWSPLSQKRKFLFLLKRD